MDINGGGASAVVTGSKRFTRTFSGWTIDIMYQLTWILRQSITRTNAVVIMGHGIGNLRGILSLWTSAVKVGLLMLLGGVAGWLASACVSSASPGPTPAADLTPSTLARVQVVATSAILADLAKNVGKDLIEVRTLVPPGVDLHSYQATPQDSIAISRARVIISNGAGLDNFLELVLQSAQQPSAIRVVASAGLQAASVVEMELPGEGGPEEELIEEVEELVHRVEGGELTAAAALTQLGELLSGDGHKESQELGDQLLVLISDAQGGQRTPEAVIEAIDRLLSQHEGEGHGHDEGDPHFWQDPLQAIHYVERIRDGLGQADPAGAQSYQANATAYIQQLRQLDQEIASTLGQVPPARRHLVTFHDAFGYFARRYGWQVSAFVASDASEVTPQKVVTVMERIRGQGIPAVFAEPQFRPDVMEQAAKDTGVRVGTIYSDTLDSKVPTYVEMMRFNARSLAQHLR
jgi:ABC-type Zn uptake system ZnuABC Zn-binding protein ZnuA